MIDISIVRRQFTHIVLAHSFCGSVLTIIGIYKGIDPLVGIGLGLNIAALGTTIASLRLFTE